MAKYNKEDFIKIFKTNIKREGSDKLLEWLMSDKSDFFTAPSSTRYHCAYEGGLVDHSINVFLNLIKQVESDKRFSWSAETLAIVSLLHDLCKVNTYQVDYRNTKDSNGQWIKVPYYTHSEKFPLEHGHKSVILIQQFMKLSGSEIMAIAGHMNGWSADQSTAGRIMDKEPLAVFLSNADMIASHIDEKENNE